MTDQRPAKMCETFSSLRILSFCLGERTDPHWTAIHLNTLIDCVEKEEEEFYADPQGPQSA